MSFREIRQEVVEDHRVLAQGLDVIEDLCARIEAGEDKAAAALRERGRGLYERFAAHLVLEDRVLVPYLQATAGSESARQLTAEHREQRELLGYLLGRLAQSGRPAVLVARELREFAALLRAEMQSEEEALLGPDGPSPAA